MVYNQTHLLFSRFTTLICLFPILARVSLLSLCFTLLLDCLVFCLVSSELMAEMVEPVEDRLMVENVLLGVSVSPDTEQCSACLVLKTLPTPPPYSVMCPRLFLPDGDLSQTGLLAGCLPGSGACLGLPIIMYRILLLADGDLSVMFQRNTVL